MSLHNNNDEEKSEFNENEFGPVQHRFVVLICFCLITLLNCMGWIMFAPISQHIQTMYNINEFSVDMLSMVFMGTYIILAIPLLRVTDRFGLRGAILLGAFLTTIGAWIRVIIPSYYGLLLGQIVISFGQLPLLGAPPKVSLTWFDSTEWSLATSIGVMANSCGGAIAYLVSPRACPHANTTDLLLYLIYFSIICTIVLILIYFCVPTLPPKPASQASALSSTWTTDKTKTTNESWSVFFSDIYQNIMKFLNEKSTNHKNGYLLTLSYGIAVGVSYTISTLLEFFLKPMSLSDTMIGWIGFFITIVGLIGSILAGIILDKYKLFKITYSLCIIFTAISLLLMNVAILFQNVIILFIGACSFGFFVTAIFPIGFEYAVELSYPIEEDLIATILNISSQIFGIIFISLFSGEIKLLLSPTLCLVLVLIIAFIASILTTEETKRLNAQNQNITSVSVTNILLESSSSASSVNNNNHHHHQHKKSFDREAGGGSTIASSSSSSSSPKPTKLLGSAISSSLQKVGGKFTSQKDNIKSDDVTAENSSFTSPLHDYDDEDGIFEDVSEQILGENGSP